MRVLVECTEDPASRNLADRLRELVGFEEQGTFEGEPVLAAEDLRLVTIDELHLHAERFDERLAGELADPEAIVFLSRHASDSGQPTMSVHPVGNFADAPYGGEAGRVAPAHPSWMAGLFHALLDRDAGGFDVTYEVTHHGPYLETPSMFYELGSTEDEWTDEAAARVLAEALLDAEPVDQTPALWVGGGHYCPQVNDAVRAGDVAPGHIVPGWATGKGVDRATLEEAVERIPGCEGYVLQPEATTGERAVAERLDEVGVERLDLA
jgi:D-aminoacyl-tRNA deacylase